MMPFNDLQHEQSAHTHTHTQLYKTHKKAKNKEVTFRRSDSTATQHLLSRRHRHTTTTTATQLQLMWEHQRVPAPCLTPPTSREPRTPTKPKDMDGSAPVGQTGLSHILNTETNFDDVIILRVVMSRVLNKSDSFPVDPLTR